MEVKEIIDMWKKKMDRTVQRYPKTNMRIRKFKYKIVEDINYND